MFNVGDLIIYSNHGVCRVDSVGKPEIGGLDEKDYYTLSQYYSSKNRFFTPVDNSKVIMRPIISKDEAKKIISEIGEIPLLVIAEEKHREDIYKETIKSCDLRSFISMIKTISIRKKARIAEGKKVTAGDEKYYNQAEDRLCGELAAALETDKEKMQECIEQQIENC